MRAYPQLAQIPVVKRLRRRTVENRLGDGRSIRLSDPAGESTEWQLQYAELTDEEAAKLQQFFEDSEGSLNGFTFVDPTANLLAWSARLDGEAWTRGPMLTASGGPAEWRLTNAGAAAQSIAQTIPAPPGLMCCFSVYARGSDGGAVTLLAGGRRAERELPTEWRRLSLSGTVEDPTFGVEIAAGASIDVRGMQVEAQAGASAARDSTTGGVYEGARFRDDALAIVATGVNRHSCRVNIIHAIHI